MKRRWKKRCEATWGDIRGGFWFTSPFFVPLVTFLACSSHQKYIKSLRNLREIRNSGFVFKANVAITQQSTLLGLLQRNTTALLTGDSGCSPLILSVSIWWMPWVCLPTGRNSGKEFLLLNYGRLGINILLVIQKQFSKANCFFMHPHLFLQ